MNARRRGEACIFCSRLASFSGKALFNVPTRGHILTGYNDGDLHEQVSGRRRTAWFLSDYRSRQVGMPSELDYQVTIL